MAAKWVFSNGKFQLAGKPQVPGDGKPVDPSGPAHQKVGGKNILTWMQEQYAAIDNSAAEYSKKNKGAVPPESWYKTQQSLVDGVVQMYNQEVLIAGDRTDAKTLADAKLAAAAVDNKTAADGASRAETLRLKIAAEKKIADEEARQRGLAGTEAAAKSLEAGGVVAKGIYEASGQTAKGIYETEGADTAASYRTAGETAKGIYNTQGETAKGIYESEGAATAENYRTAGKTAQEKAMETIRNLYGGMDEKNAEDLRVALEQLGVDVESAKTNVTKAGTDFISGYNPSKVYETAPVMQESVGANPLLDSLRSQGADTSEVTAATADSNATLQQFAAFQKWANSNLNIGQQNFDTGMKNVSGQATATGLQGIAARQPVINSGIKRDYAGYQQTINQGRSEATTAADEALAEAIARGDAAAIEGNTKGATALADAIARGDTALADAIIKGDAAAIAGNTKGAAALADAITKGDAAMASAQGDADAERAKGLITYGVPPVSGSLVANNNAAKTASTVYPNFKAALAALHPNRPTQSLAKDKLTFSKLYASFKNQS